jgi:hypothetical protein
VELCVASSCFVGGCHRVAAPKGLPRVIEGSLGVTLSRTTRKEGPEDEE